LAPANHRVLRNLNEVMVLNVIRERQPVSRSEIAGLIGLEGSTVSKIVSRLVDDRLVFEEGLGKSSSQGGRKKRFLHLNPRKASAIGVDLRPSGYTVALSDFTGRILRSIEVPPHSSPMTAATDLARAIRLLLRSPASETIEGIGVSLVGLVDPREGRVLAGEGLGWGEDVPVGSLLRKALDMDLPIYFENGAWLGALAEIWFGKYAHHTRDLVFLDIADGIGSGIIVNGQLYHGSFYGAGEFGHIPLHPEGPACSCGARGCLEAYASDPATIRRYVELCRARGRDVRNGSINAVVAQAMEGSPEAAEALRTTATYLGRGLVPVIYSLNPEVVVVGGAISCAWHLIRPVIWSELAARASRYYLDHLTLVPTTLEARPSLVGAIALVLARAFSVPSLVWQGENI
jgi:predicted NBD/HSP70 family sugar kinase